MLDERVQLQQPDGFKEIARSENVVTQSPLGVMNDARTLAWDARLKIASGLIFWECFDDRAQIGQIAFMHGDAVANGPQIVGVVALAPAAEAVDFHFRMVPDDVFRKITAARTGNPGDQSPFNLWVADIHVVQKTNQVASNESGFHSRNGEIRRRERAASCWE